jgi:adenosylcobinamide kinase/adenosylcobinamide-phosphate guanylyltransferase
MATRIGKHRAARAARTPPWSTVEEPWDVPAQVAAQPQAGCLLLEDLGLWLTNLLIGLPGRPACTDAEVQCELDRLLAALEAGSGRAVIVSQEVGLGIVPVNALARRFGDLLGAANQHLAARADAVYLCVAGIPMRIK